MLISRCQPREVGRGSRGSVQGKEDSERPSTIPPCILTQSIRRRGVLVSFSYQEEFPNFVGTDFHLGQTRSGIPGPPPHPLPQCKGRSAQKARLLYCAPLVSSAGEVWRSSAEPSRASSSPHPVSPQTRRTGRTNDSRTVFQTSKKKSQSTG